MTDTPRYLAGFLAAVSPEKSPALDGSPNETRPAPDGSAAGENLSVEERIKRRLHPLDSFPRLLDCVAANRPPDADDQFRFRWFGLFYQAPRQDAFLLRLRLPGGWLETFQLAALANIIQELAGGHLLLNPQGGLDIPGVPVRAAAEILRRTEGIGLSARQTGGDCVQCIRANIRADDPCAAVHPLVGTLEQAVMHSRMLADLPRPCEIVLRMAGEPSGAPQAGEIDTLILQSAPEFPSPPADGPRANDTAPFLLVVPGDPAGGYLIPPSRAVLGCLKLLEAWAAGADRTDRQRAGMATFYGVLGRDGISALLANAPWQPRQDLPSTGSASKGQQPLPGFAIPGGRLLSNQLFAVENILRGQGLGGTRLHRGFLYLTPTLSDAVGDPIKQALASR